MDTATNNQLRSWFEDAKEVGLRNSRRASDLQTILDALPSMVFCKDYDNTILRCNKIAAEVVNATREQMEGEPTERFWPEHAEKYLKDDREVLRTASPKLNIIEPLKHPDGSVSWIHTDKYPLFNDKAETDRLLVIATDITEQYVSRAERQATEDRLALALSASQIGIWDWDLTTNVLAWDQRMHVLFDTDSTSTTIPFDLAISRIFEEDQPGVHAALEKALAERSEYAMNYRVRHRNGEVRHISARGKVCVDPDTDEPIRVTGVCVDITEVSVARDQANAAAEMIELKSNEMEQFVYTISHDLKSPVVSATGLLRYLKEDLESGDAESVEDGIRRLDRNLKRINDCISDLLELSRIGRVRHEPEPVNFSKMSEELVDSLDATLRDADIAVTVAPDLPTLSVDPVRAVELIENLVRNAIVHGCTKPDPRIAIVSALDDNEIRVGVRDFGVGIDPAYQDKIFKLFQRLKNDDQGTGLGLAVVSRIMQLYDGRAWVDSKPQEGATFWLGFPKALICDANLTAA